MIIAAVVLFVLQHTRYGSQVLRQQSQMPNLNALLDSVMPKKEEIDQAFQPRLDVEELNSKDIGILTKDGQVLRARVSKPAGHGPFPVVVIIHDGPSSTRSTDQAATTWGESLAKSQQVLTITPDWREGVMGEEEVVDLLATIDWLGKLLETKGQNITLFGMDHGVYIALSLMATQGESITGLIAAYGYSDIAAQYDFLVAHDARGAENFLDASGCSNQTAVALCLKNLSRTDLAITVPTLLIHGEQDSVVPLAQSQQIANQVNDSANLTVEYMPDPLVDHFFLNKETNPGFVAGKQYIQEWLTQHQ